MNKHVKILIFVIVLITLIAFFLFFSNQDKENTNNGEHENSGINIDSNSDNTNIQNESQEANEVMKNKKIKLSINNHELTATLNYNSSSVALIEELKKGPITVNMSDYANMEKVGDLGVELPRNDENITTSSGDLILYQGSSFVIYYDTNHWSLTRLGKIDDINSQELKDILGDGDVIVKLSLN